MFDVPVMHYAILLIPTHLEVVVKGEPLALQGVFEY